MSDSPHTDAAELPEQTEISIRLGDPIAWWANDLRVAGSKDRYSGFVIQVDQTDEDSGQPLHPEFNDALRQDQWPQIRLQHESGASVSYWALEAPVVFVICKGLPERSQFGMQGVDNKGIRAWYGPMGRARREGEEVRNGTHVQFRALVKDFAIPAQPIVFSTKGMGQTRDMTDALYAQVRVLRWINQEKGRSFPFYVLGIPLVAGNPKTVKGKKGSSLVTPPTHSIPKALTAEYAQTVQNTKEGMAACRELLEETLAWARSVPTIQAVETEEA